MRFMEKILYSLAKKASHYDINLITINLKKWSDNIFEQK